MKVVFLGSTRSDLQWFEEYYREVFPSGSRRATVQFAQAVRDIATIRTSADLFRPVVCAVTAFRVFPSPSSIM